MDQLINCYRLLQNFLIPQTLFSIFFLVLNQLIFLIILKFQLQKRQKNVLMIELSKSHEQYYFKIKSGRKNQTKKLLRHFNGRLSQIIRSSLSRNDFPEHCFNKQKVFRFHKFARFYGNTFSKCQLNLQEICTIKSIYQKMYEISKGFKNKSQNFHDQIYQQILTMHLKNRFSQMERMIKYIASQYYVF